MLNAVYVENFVAPKFNQKEILRYAGVKEPIEQIVKLVDECVIEAQDKLCYKVCYAFTPVKISGRSVDLGFSTFSSNDLAKNLNGCDSAVIFCATVGIGIDRLIEKYSAVSTTKALIFQAIGAERIESLCNAFNDKVKNIYNFTTPRFSAGYGDLSVQVQRDIFALLECNKKIGVTLNQSLLMSPSKSVTAIIGGSDKCLAKMKSGCTACNKADCDFRRS